MSELFDKIWEATKKWEVNIGNRGYSGMSGDEVRIIVATVEPILEAQAAEIERLKKLIQEGNDSIRQLYRISDAEYSVDEYLIKESEK